MTSRPNIVCIISDDTNFAELGCYGGQALTPHIDRIAARGVRFNQAYCASSVCTPSRFNYLTGLYGGHCTADHFLAQNPPDEPYCIAWNTYLHEGLPSLGRLFSAQGYRTGYVGKWHTGRGWAELDIPDLNADDDPNDPAVDTKLRAYQAAVQAEIKRTGGFDFAGGIIWDNADLFPIKALRHHNLDWITQNATQFLDSCSADQPFVLYMATTVRHGPSHGESLQQDARYTHGGKLNSTPETTARGAIQARLAAAGLPAHDNTLGLTWLDDQVGVILGKLEEMDALDNTIVIYCTDHNTEPGKGTCYERGIRIPWVMAWPDHIVPSTVSEGHIQNVDFLPTMLDACGIPADMPLDGTSFWPLLTGEAATIHDDLYFEFGYQRGVRTPQWKYIAFRYPAQLIAQMQDGTLTEAPNHINHRLQGQAHVAMHYYPGLFDPDQLYDLADDPTEQHNLAQDPAYTDVLRMMQARLQSHLDRFAHPFDLEPDEFMQSDDYRALVAATQQIGTDHIPWFNPTELSLEFGALI